MKRVHQISFVALIAATWFLFAFLFGLPTTILEAAKPFASAMTVAAVFFLLYDRCIWRWKWQHGWFTQKPCLAGVWQVTIRSTFKDPDTGKQIEPLIGYAQIDQTSSTFCMRIFTAESQSKTISYAFDLDQNVYRLAIVYENAPSIELRGSSSPLHKGSAVFNVRGFQPESFLGDYWTERDTKGTMQLQRRLVDEINSFEDGVKMYET